MTTYKAPEQDYLFLLKELIKYDSLCELPGFAEMDFDMVASIIPEAAKFFEQVIAPTNKTADQQGAHLKDGKVDTPAVLEGLYPQMCESGWLSLSADPAYGGAGFPGVVGSAVMEMMQTANVGFSLMPTLTQGVIHALGLYGSEEQKQTYLHKLVTGTWSGTMNLTEPHAGSDLSVIKTRATPKGDHYLISGQKIFITWGDHELAENIIHLVLARTPDAPEGTQGISMFIVPKYLLNDDGTPGQRNDVKTVGVEHKLGIHASPTCALQFGDQGGAIGYLVGEENKGLVYMFAMMNQARLSVGSQGVAVSERAYQHALAYAKDRIQGALPGSSGKVAIIEHPDVRRMLMLMRSITDAGRAISLYAIACEDRKTHGTDEPMRASNNGLIETLTPIAKGWCTEMSMEVASLGIQVHGGMGFIEETGAAQFLRDSRILPIYEGTNAIQGLDFIGRKTLRDGGKEIRHLLAELETLLAGAEKLDELYTAASDALQQCEQALEWVLANPAEAPAVAVPYLMLFGNAVGAVLLIHVAARAQHYIDDGDNNPFYKQKIAAAGFFVHHVLPRNDAFFKTLTDGSKSIMALSVDEL